MLLEEIEHLEGRIEEIEGRMREVFSSSEEVELLQSIPGVGFILAVVIALRLGIYRGLVGLSGLSPTVVLSQGLSNRAAG